MALSVLDVSAIAGVYFLLKGRYRQHEDAGRRQGFFRGDAAEPGQYTGIALLVVCHDLPAGRAGDKFQCVYYRFFSAGIWLGKMCVLWLCAVFSKKISCIMGYLARNINRVIGVVLLFTLVIRLVKQGL